jgi:hypothetical protein
MSFFFKNQSQRRQVMSTVKKKTTKSTSQPEKVEQIAKKTSTKKTE